MGACVARCLPLYSDPRYQPVRSRYLIQDDVVQLELVGQEGQPRRGSLLSKLAALLCRLRPKAEDEVELTRHAEQPVVEEREGETEEEEEHSSQLLRYSYRMEGDMPGEERRWWGRRSGAIGSLPSLTEPDSPPTASLDLEWEPEAALAAARQERVEKGTGTEATATSGTEEEPASQAQTVESGNSWMPRSSSCSTPNSLEWDFRASTLSLRGEDEMSWRHTDMETEQLLYEIEQLAARALADTGHVLHKTGSSVEDFKETPPR